jgi:hypothetical protein
VILLRIPLKGIFNVGDALEITIPTIQIHKAAEKDNTLVPVVRADAFHLIQKESLVERDNRLL